jgi:hypothetical protein
MVDVVPFPVYGVLRTRLYLLSLVKPKQGQALQVIRF